MLHDDCIVYLLTWSWGFLYRCA